MSALPSTTALKMCEYRTGFYIYLPCLSLIVLILKSAGAGFWFSAFGVVHFGVGVVGFGVGVVVGVRKAGIGSALQHSTQEE